MTDACASAFIEDWYLDADAHTLADLCASTELLDGAVIEVGCWEGRSTVMLANLVAPAMVEAVDTWQGSPGEPCWEAAKQRDVFGAFSRNVADQTAGNVRAHRLDWREFFQAWDGPVRFLHIDGAHTFAEVRDNVAAALLLIVVGGVIAGHDAEIAAVREGACAALGEVHVDGNIWWWRKQISAKQCFPALPPALRPSLRS